MNKTHAHKPNLYYDDGPYYFETMCGRILFYTYFPLNTVKQLWVHGSVDKSHNQTKGISCKNCLKIIKNAAKYPLPPIGVTDKAI